jgi:dihydrofolate reductase
MICSVFVGVSVDGFMARPDGRFDFLPADGGEEHGYSAFIASIDAIVMGRGTFDVVLGFDHWPFRQPVIVLTSRPCDAELPANAVLEFMSAEPIEVVARLAARGMQHLYVDGGITIQRFLNAGLIDRATITRDRSRHPAAARRDADVQQRSGHQRIRCSADVADARRSLGYHLPIAFERLIF